MNPIARRSTATLAATALIGTPLALLTTVPAHADFERERHFRVAGADVDFSVEKDDGRFEVDVDIDDARPGSKWRIILKHDGKRFLRTVRVADDDGEVDIDRNRRNTRGADRFTVKVKQVGGPATSRTIRMR